MVHVGLGRAIRSVYGGLSVPLEKYFHALTCAGDICLTFTAIDDHWLRLNSSRAEPFVRLRADAYLMSWTEGGNYHDYIQGIYFS